MAAAYVLAFFELADDEGETDFVVIADVICITPRVSKQRKVEIHTSHLSEEGRGKA
jgi:hypothetical protein